MLDPRHLPLFAVLACSLAACGGVPPTGEAPLPLPVPAPSGAPQPEQPVRPTPSAAQSVLGRVWTVAQHLRSLSGHDYEDVVGPDGSETWDRTDVYLSRPAPGAPVEFASTVTSASDAGQVGTKIVYDDGDQVHIHTFVMGFLGLKVTLSVTDQRMLDAYGRSLKDTGYDQMIAVLFSRSARVTALGSATVGGEAVQMLDVRSPASWRTVSHEVFGISDRTGFPIYRDQFDASGKRFDHWYEVGQQLDAPLPSDAFDL